MNEIDLYVNLLDERETDKILSFFNDTTKLKDINFKKLKVKRHLKGLGGKPVSKQAPNPFKYVIYKHGFDLFEDFSEKQFFMLMKDPRISNLEDYEKFANALIYFPEKTQKLLPKMEENFNNNKSIFDLEGFEFETEEELNEYLVKVSLYSNEKFLLKFLKDLEKHLSDEDKKKIEEREEKISKWNIKDFYNNISQDKLDIPVYLTQFAFLKTHLAKMDMNVTECFLLDIMGELLNKYKKANLLSKETDENRIEIENIKGEFSKIKQEFEKYKSEAYAYKKEISSLKKENEKLLKNLETQKVNEEEYKKIIDSLKLKLEQEIKKSEEKLEKLKLNYENSIKILKSEKEAAEGRIKEFKSYIEYVFTPENSEEHIFAVVHSIDIAIAKTIYPEVLFIPIDEWGKNMAESRFNGIKELYIQRQGVSYIAINKIEEYCREKGINKKIIDAGNEKKLIEVIAKLK